MDRRVRGYVFRIEIRNLEVYSGPEVRSFELFDYNFRTV